MGSWKIIWNIIKPFLPWIICIIVILYAFGMTKSYIQQTHAKKAWKQNFEVKNIPGRQVQLTKEDLEDYYQKYVAIAKQIEIKSKQIEHIVTTDYYYVVDTIDPSVLPFKQYYEGEAEVGCFDFTFRDTKKSKETLENIKSIAVHDSLITYLYWKKKRTIDFKLFALSFGKKQYMAKTYSSCKGDTIQVQDNIKIVKKVE